MPLFLERAGHRHGHGLLLGSVFEILRLGEQPVFGEERADLIEEVTAEGISKGDHGLKVGQR